MLSCVAACHCCIHCVLIAAACQHILKGIIITRFGIGGLLISFCMCVCVYLCVCVCVYQHGFGDIRSRVSFFEDLVLQNQTVDPASSRRPSPCVASPSPAVWVDATSQSDESTIDLSKQVICQLRHVVVNYSILVSRFYTRDAMLALVLAVVVSLCVCVCVFLSVTCRYCI